MQSSCKILLCLLVFIKCIRPLLGSEIDAVISSLTLKGFSGRIVRQSDSVDPNFMIYI